jgi:hypothetical protein
LMAGIFVVSFCMVFKECHKRRHNYPRKILKRKKREVVGKVDLCKYATLSHARLKGTLSQKKPPRAYIVAAQWMWPGFVTCGCGRDSETKANNVESSLLVEASDQPDKHLHFSNIWMFMIEYMTDDYLLH